MCLRNFPLKFILFSSIVLSSRPKTADSSSHVRKLRRKLNYESKRSHLLQEQVKHLQRLNRHICQKVGLDLDEEEDLTAGV